MARSPLKAPFIDTGLYYQWPGRFFGSDAMRLVNGLPQARSAILAEQFQFHE
jgi:hypothetical protein